MTMHGYLGLCIIFAFSVVVCKTASNCNDLQQAANGALSSGTYSVANSNGQAFTVYCQFYSGYGYTFVSKNSNVDIDMTSLYDDTTHVIIRHKRSNGNQYTAKMEQLSSHSSTPISVQYNIYTGYNAPHNVAMTPYIYVGFIPASMTYRGATQGWKCNGQDYTFSNCDANPNSYFVFLFNQGSVSYTSYGGGYNALMFNWYDDSTAVTSGEFLPDEFFSSYYEIHHGGCGGYAKSDAVSAITGATVGLKFVTQCATPSDISSGTKSYSGTSVGSTLTYSCGSGLVVLSGDSTRTCTASGGWSGTEPVCGVHGGWSGWSSWAGCTVTCDSGTWTRSRSCTNPVPVNGNTCAGSGTETGTCTLSGCTVDGSWSVWTSWTTCDVTCGGGTTTRTRSCSDPPASNAGAPCSGDDSETNSCNTNICPIDGSWSVWTSWTTCDVTCGGGTTTRTRSCSDPPASNGGSPCSGDDSETNSCNTNNCPINGGFTDWSQWGTCSLVCGGGTSSRSRTCSNPTPQHGGQDCNGATAEDKSCNTQTCPVDGGFSDWSTWSQCTVTCGTGTSDRSRACTNPAPLYGGLDCAGAKTEQNNCNTNTCPSIVNGNWGTWESWTTCSKTCGSGRYARLRQCNNPVPSGGGNQCHGNVFEVENCNTQDCPNTSNGSYVNICPNAFFTCRSGTITCIHELFVCDCTTDCDDGSDEEQNWASCSTQQCRSGADGLLITRFSVLIPLVLVLLLLVF